MGAIDPLDSQQSDENGSCTLIETQVSWKQDSRPAQNRNVTKVGPKNATLRALISTARCSSLDARQTWALSCDWGVGAVKCSGPTSKMYHATNITDRSSTGKQPQRLNSVATRTDYLRLARWRSQKRRVQSFAVIIERTPIQLQSLSRKFPNWACSRQQHRDP